MEKRMKVMIAYDGSTYADAALDDLRRAGLPNRCGRYVEGVEARGFGDILRALEDQPFGVWILPLAAR